jgi:hypothetical protein
MSGVLRCESCGELIGVYEPLVRVLDGRAHESSRLLEPQLTGRNGECFHRACYERRDGEEVIAE